MDKKQSMLEKTKGQIITQIYNFVFILLLLAVIGNTIMVYQIITGTSDYKSIPSYFYVDILLLIFFGISLFYINRAPRTFIWIFLIFFSLFFILEPSLISFSIVIPILIAAFLIKPLYSFWATIFYASEVTILLYFDDKTLNLTIWLEKYLLLYFYVIIISIFAWFLSKEFHKAFHFYEIQNANLQETKGKLLNKVEIQNREIKNIKEEKDQLKNQLESMHYSLDELKSATVSTKERLEQQIKEKKAKEEKLRKIFEG